MTTSSVDERYRLVIYMIGEPDWPFGATHCRFELFDGSKKIIKYSFQIFNDGGTANKENFDVIWSSDSVNITVSGKEQNEKVYVLNYDGTFE